MRNGKSVNKVYISILNCHPETNFKREAFWFVFKSFCYRIFINFPKNFWWYGVGWKQKRAVIFCLHQFICEWARKIIIVTFFTDSAKSPRSQSTSVNIYLVTLAHLVVRLPGRHEVVGSNPCWCATYLAENITVLSGRRVIHPVSTPYKNRLIILWTIKAYGSKQVHFGVFLKFCRTFGRTILVTSSVSIKTLTKSHDYSRLFSQEKHRLKNTSNPTKIG